MESVQAKISLDALIEIVANGGRVKTGIDVFNRNDVLMLGKDVLVDNVSILHRIKKNGVLEVPVNQDENGGVWNGEGKKIVLKPFEEKVPEKTVEAVTTFDLEAKLKQISEEKNEASMHYRNAQKAIRAIFSEIKKSGGSFDVSIAERTVTEISSYVVRNDNAVAYLINEILSYDSYLHNHSVNVCILATAVLNRFKNYSEETKIDFLSEDPQGLPEKYNDDLQDRHQMGIAFFLHDTGKVLVDERILNKQGPLSPEEFDSVKKHSYVNGLEILQKNNINNVLVENVVAYHHSPLYPGEINCYPEDKTHSDIPTYVKICKLADIYDARTSKRSYKEAQNPAEVVSDMFKSYANKDKSLQLILHSFVNIIGICPPGSIVFLSNGQLAYVLDGNGPIVIPFTDGNGITLTRRTDPVDLSDKQKKGLSIDRRVPIVFPVELYNKLPPYLRASLK